MKKIAFIFGLVFVGQFGLSPVYAAQTAKVIVDNASVLDKPQADGAVVGTVPKDTPIAVSNVATNGYFKSRIPSGAIGWISGNDILTGAPPVMPETTPAVAAAAGKPTPPKRPAEKKRKDASDQNDQSRIMISAGMQILNNGGFPAGISNDKSKTGFGGTLEMQFKINEIFYWAGRAEYFTSSSSQTTAAGKAQTLSFHTIPVMGGIVYVPISKKDYRFGVGLYGGLALGTSLAVTQTTTSASAAATYSSSDITFYGNLQGSVAVSNSISVLGDFGYRLESGTYPASPATTGLGVDAFTANFGGLVARLGVEFRL